MIRLEYGKIERVENSRAVVRLSGYDADARVDAVIAFPGGGQTVKTWLPPVAGDVVAVVVDEERPEDSLVVGGVYCDGQAAPKSGDVVALQAPEVWLGASVDDAQKAARDDRVQRELAAIKAELDAIKAAFSAHVHSLPPMVAGSVPVSVLPTGEGPGVTGAAPVYSQGYSVGETASDSVWVK